MDLLELASAREGHFRLESGHHSDLWLDLNGLFIDDEQISPFVRALSERLQHYQIGGVCGPIVGGAYLAQRVAIELRIPFFFVERFAWPSNTPMYSVRYRLPSIAQSRVRGLRLAIVDDVMSAGSALRGTYANLREHDADVVVAGALMVLGEVGARFFRGIAVPLESVVTQPFNVWDPDECPLCRAGMPIEGAP
jgi:orotate phosphoribosyltransferase